MGDKLTEIKVDYKRGRMTFENMEWLINSVGELQQENREIRKNSRFLEYLKIAHENLNLVQENVALQEALDKAEEKLVNV